MHLISGAGGILKMRLEKDGVVEFVTPASLPRGGDLARCRENGDTDPA